MLPTVRAIVLEADTETGVGVVFWEGVTTTVYPQDGALPEPGQYVTCVLNGGDLVPVASSQRTTGTIRGAVEADSFLGVSETVVDAWAPTWLWTPLANNTVAQPTVGVDPGPWMRLTRTNFNGRLQATATTPIGATRRYMAVELSAPAAADGGRNCYVEVAFLYNGGVLATHTYTVDNLTADPRTVQSEPLLPPVFTDTMRVTVYSQQIGLVPGSFMDVRCRAWTVPVFQGGALVDLDGNVLADHRGLLINGYPVNEPDRTVTLVAGTGVPAGVTSPADANLINFPTFNASTSSLRWKFLTGTRVNVKLTVACTGAAPASDQMWFRVPFVSRDHEILNATYHNSGVAWKMGQARIDKATNEAYLTHGDAGNFGNVDEANPFTFGNQDMIVVSGSYEIQTV